MDVSAKTRFTKMSAEKAHDLARRIQGLKVADALKAIQFSERKTAKVLCKTLKSAIANAENNAKLSAEDLFVKTAAIGHGPAMSRFWPTARGSASPIRKRMSHVLVTLSDGKETQVGTES